MPPCSDDDPFASGTDVEEMGCLIERMGDEDEIRDDEECMREEGIRCIRAISSACV